MAEEIKHDFDFDFITASLGLLPIEGGLAINPAKITELCIAADEQSWVLTIEGGESYDISFEEMAALEKTIRARSEAMAAIRRASIEADARTQLEAQAKALADLNSRVAPGDMVITGGPSKRFRQ